MAILKCVSFPSFEMPITFCARNVPAFPYNQLVQRIHLFYRKNERHKDARKL